MWNAELRWKTEAPSPRSSPASGRADRRPRCAARSPGLPTTPRQLGPPRVLPRTATPRILLLLVAFGTGCTQQMSEQPRLEPLEASAFFDDGRASRKPVEGTVARGRRPHVIHTTSRVFRTGLKGEEPVDQLPPEVTEDRELKDVLARGRQRYEVFCVPCHGLLGDGRGFVVRRGFPAPPSFHNPRLRSVPLGHFFRVMTDGRGKMASYAGQIPPADRWSIAAYVRVLQFSRYAPLDRLAPSDRDQLPADAEADSSPRDDAQNEASDENSGDAGNGNDGS